MESIIVAIITGAMSLIGVIITQKSGNRKVEESLRTHQAVTDSKIEELTREVREHNNFARRMPVVEEKINAMEKTVDELKSYHKPTT